MVYDGTNEQSFRDVKGFWQSEVEQHSEKSISVLLLGNKMDLPGEEVTEEQAGQYAKSKNYMFIQTSAKTGGNVEESFYKLARKLLEEKLMQVSERKPGKPEAKKTYPAPTQQLEPLLKEREVARNSGCC